eukprot:TRINITY_DN2470_c0_g1_i1.p1 TRINITY_DN2470_c0_g1~~TRINITY_DN2470_c0_g1_i1.p1  ORF type:complete len:1135 (-),score=264.18 TRINITY_DN2470_c0_g1_i1:134-3169(-)
MEKAANMGEEAERSPPENRDEGDDEGYASSRELAEPSLPGQQEGTQDDNTGGETDAYDDDDPEHAANDEGDERVEDHGDEYDADQEPSAVSAQKTREEESHHDERGDGEGDSYLDEHDDFENHDGRANHTQGDALDNLGENGDTQVRHEDESPRDHENEHAQVRHEDESPRDHEYEHENDQNHAHDKDDYDGVHKHGDDDARATQNAGYDDEDRGAQDCADTGHAADDDFERDDDDDDARERRDVHSREAFGATNESMGYTQDWQDDGDAGRTGDRMAATTGTEYTNYSTISGNENFEESAEDQMKATGDVDGPPIPANDGRDTQQDENCEDDECQSSTRQSKAVPEKQGTIKIEQDEADQTVTQRIDLQNDDGCEEEAVTKEHPTPAVDLQDTGGRGTLKQEPVEEERDVWGDQDVEGAILLFKNGDFSKAENLAKSAANNCKCKAQLIMEETGRALSEDRRPRSRPSSAASAADTGDAWRSAMDELAAAYEDAGDSDRAEALYLRMLAWREGAEQYETANFAVSEDLFKKSPSYRSVEDATWFLQNLRPDDGHAAAEAVGLLALGDEVAAKAAVAVWTLALRPAQREKLTECGALELVAKAVAFHVDNAELQAAGCGALRLLCAGHTLASRNRRRLISNLGGAESITASIRLHQDDPEVQREACGALRAAAAKNPAGARRIIENDGFKLCLQAIVRCPDEAVGKMACKALEALQCASKVGFKSTDAQSENLEAVWSAKLRAEREAGLQFCNDQIRDLLGSRDRIVIEALLGAVSIFVEDGAVRYRALNLVEPVVACMQTFPGVGKIQLHCCKFLWSITVGTDVAQAGTMQGAMARQEGVAKVADSGALGPICQAMKDVPCDASLQCLAIGTIRNVTYGNDRNKTLAVRAGGIPETCMAMQRFPKDAKLQEQAIGALTSLCDTLGRATVAARLGSIESIIGALKRHGNEVQAGHLAELGCIVLCMFCDDQQLRQQIQQKGAMSIAKVISRATNPEAQRWGFELLKGLSEP